MRIYHLSTHLHCGQIAAFCPFRTAECQGKSKSGKESKGESKSQKEAKRARTTQGDRERERETKGVKERQGKAKSQRNPQRGKELMSQRGQRETKRAKESE